MLREGGGGGGGVWLVSMAMNQASRHFQLNAWGLMKLKILDETQNSI